MKPKSCCKNCHFLAKTHIGSNGHGNRGSWDSDDRSRCHLADHYVAECAKGVWSERIDPTVKNRLKEVLLQPRKDDCFFIEEHPGMSFPAAYKLFRIRNDNRQLRRSYKYTQIALVIAAAGLVVNVCLQLGKILGWLPQ